MKKTTTTDSAFFMAVLRNCELKKDVNEESKGLAQNTQLMKTIKYDAKKPSQRLHYTYKQPFA
jgi:hypothetical protein